MSVYKTAIAEAMTWLGGDPSVRFIGYGVANGKAVGTLAGVRPEQLIETPVAENLMCGAAIGMALAGLRPVVYYERFDFVLNAADAIVNHLDKIKEISAGEFSPGVIIRVTVGNKLKPLFTGATHTQDLSAGFINMLGFPVVRLTNDSDTLRIYRSAYDAMCAGQSTMVVEYKDFL